MSTVKERKNIKEKYKWDLSALATDEKSWQERLDKLESALPELVSYKGKLGDDAELLKYLKFNDELSIELGKLYLYANMTMHTDMRVASSQAMSQKVGMTVVKFSSAVSFATPEICERSEENLLALSKKPEFSDYDYMLQTLAKSKKHVLSAAEEKLLAGIGTFGDGFQDAFAMFNNADVKFDKIKINGEDVEMSHGVYGLALQNPDRSVREAGFKSMFNAFKNYINTIASLYGKHVQETWFFAKTRKFESCLERALFNNDVDPAAYKNLIKAVDNNCKTMHNYMAFRKKVLGNDTLEMWDLHTSIVKGVDISLPYEKAFKLVKEALKPLGDDYGELLQTAYENRWIDVFENKGKRSGAYSWGTFGAHPNVLLNYQQTSHDVFTIAHELGHTIHSYKSMAAQPVAKSDYVIFVAEIASTVNEVLLLKYLMKKAEPEMKKYLLSYYLDMFRTTLFRQTMFAEFELAAHTLAEQDKPITADALNEIYLGLNKKYYGKAVNHGDLIKYEWARIPHFYTDYYVYQYATGITAAVSIATNILKNGQSAVDGYMKFLSAGGSMPPLDILKLAGVDLATEAPFELAMKEFKDTLSELKKLF